MALFKVSKGASGNLSGQALNDGYCWFTYDEGKFYIDYTDPSDSVVKRKALSAEKADKDNLGNIIKTAYAASLNLSDHTLTLLSKDGTSLSTITLPDEKVAQNNTTTNANYRVLLSYGANNNNETNTVNKNGNLQYNPSTNLLSTGNANLTGNLDVVGNSALHGATTIDNLTAGSLVVTGGASFAQTPTAPTAAAGTSNTQLATTEFVANVAGKATQGSTTTTSWRKVLLNGGSGDTYATWDADVAVKTDVLYQSKSIAVQPSTGTLRSVILQAGNLTIGGTSTAANTIVSSTTLYLNRGASTSMIFQLNGTENARFNTSGNFIIGLSSGQNDITDKLYVNGTSNFNGVIKALANQYTDSYSGALNMNNSNIFGLNSIYTADASDNASEGIHFYRDATHVDTLWMNGGDLLFVPNRVIGTGTSKADSQKVGRFTVNPTSGQIVIADGTTGGIKTTGYTIATSVPSGAVFTDTKNTAGSTQTSGDLFLIGATSQDANPQTYSSSQLKFVNSTNTLQTQNIELTGTLAVTGLTTLNNNLIAQGITATNLLVTGSTVFNQIPTAPTAAAGTSDGQLATTQFVSNMYANLNGALVFKGIVSNTNLVTTDSYTPHQLNLSNYEVGYTYRISGTSFAFTDSGDTSKVLYAEDGDLLICISTTSGTQHWVLAQANIDGAVTSSSVTSTDNCIARFDGNTGKIIQNSSVTIDDNDVLTSPTKIQVSNTNGSISLAVSSNYTARGVNDDTSGKFLIYTNGSTTYIPNWKNKGSATQPMYIDSNGVAQSLTGSIANNTTGNAATATTALTASYVRSYDTRSVTINPSDLDAAINGVRFDFKNSTVTGLNGYSGVMSYRPYAKTSDWSGGPAHQLAFDANGLHWRKSSNDTTWTGWKDILFMDSIKAGDGIALTAAAGEVTISGTIVTIKDWTVNS